MMGSPIQNPVNERAMEKMEEEFWNRYNKAIERAKALTTDRQKSYIGEGRCILEGAICGEKSMLYEINKKNIRLRGLLKVEAEHPEITSKTADTVEDTLLDMINYAAFHIVYREMVKNRSCEVDIIKLIKQENFDKPSKHNELINKMRTGHE